MGKYGVSSFWKIQTITSVISTGMVLVLLGLMVLLGQAARMLADSVKENLTVTVVLEDEADDAKAHLIADTLQQKPYVAGLQYISREEALREHVESMGIGSAEFLDSNPFSISFEIKMKPEYSDNDSLAWISKELESTPMVTDVIYQDDLVKSVNENIRRVCTALHHPHHEVGGSAMELYPPTFPVEGCGDRRTGSLAGRHSPLGSHSLGCEQRSRGGQLCHPGEHGHSRRMCPGCGSAHHGPVHIRLCDTLSEGA